MTESVLTDEQIVEIVAENFELAHRNYDDDMILARVIESAVLQSPEVVALRKDAERYRWLRKQCKKYYGLTIAKVDRTEISGWSGDDPDAAIDAAMEAKP